MEASEPCANCGATFTEATAEGACPQCGSAAPQEPIWTKLRSPWFIARAALGLALGITPGIFFYVYGHGQAPLVIVLGAFIGLACALANVSARNVAAGMAGVIIARNAPRSMQGAIMEHFTG